jgi:hypothetical protein
MTRWCPRLITRTCLPIRLMYSKDWDTTPWLKIQRPCGHGFVKQLHSSEVEVEVDVDVANATIANVTIINEVCTALNPKDQSLSIKILLPRISQNPIDQVANHLRGFHPGRPETTHDSVTVANSKKIPATASRQAAATPSRSSFVRTLRIREIHSAKVQPRSGKTRHLFVLNPPR